MNGRDKRHLLDTNAVISLLRGQASLLELAKGAEWRGGDIRWHGRQRGRITLAERKLNVKRPRLRGVDGKIMIPAYERLREDSRLGSRLREIWRRRNRSDRQSLETSSAGSKHKTVCRDNKRCADHSTTGRCRI